MTRLLVDADVLVLEFDTFDLVITVVSVEIAYVILVPRGKRSFMVCLRHIPIRFEYVKRVFRTRKYMVSWRWWSVCVTIMV